MAQKCILSWKKYCPDYEIIEWNENNFDMHYCKYVEEAYNAKKWAFVSDVARLYVLVKYGGIYMDTDVEVLRPLDDLLKYEAVSGFESVNRIPTGLMASVAEQPLFAELLHEYDDIHFLKEDGQYDTTTNVIRITNTCLKYGLQLNNSLQTVNGFTLLPSDYLCPKNYDTKVVNITNNTYTIHHFDGSWLSEKDKLKERLFEKYKRFMPSRFARFYAEFKAIRKIYGIKTATKEVCLWMRNKVKRHGKSKGGK